MNVKKYLDQNQASSGNAMDAFTLIELLVVISIISMLISILLPALAGARKAAQQIKCASSMRQDGIAMRLYVQDNRYYPPPFQKRADGSAAWEGGVWDELLLPY